MDGATPHLLPKFLALIASDGPMPFSRFMETALYDPDGGYYTDSDRPRIGRSGDFFTSVSVGPLFGRLLGRRLRDFWDHLGRPEEFHLLEPGPEGGQLALDILQAARDHDPEFHQALRYHACEPVPAKQARLQSRFDAAGCPNARAVSAPDAVRGRFGAVLANEILDALPVHLVTFQSGKWLERYVTAKENELSWTLQPIRCPDLAAATTALGLGFPDGYTTEVCLRHPPFLASLAACFEHSLMILIDYGFSREDLYLPARTEGTLRTYRNHHAGDSPLEDPGTRDITAHVNFSAVLDTGRRLGLHALGFTRQERYLTAIATPILHQLVPESPDTTSFVRQFQTLVHPSLLGSKFHVLEFSKNVSAPNPDPFQFDPNGLCHLHPDS